MLPLEGLRVLDLSEEIAGPYAAMLLAEQGAEVLKLEPPDGEPGRRFPGFHVWNRSKIGAVFNPSDGHDCDELQRLLDPADILVTSWNPGAGPTELAPVTLGSRYPRLVHLWMPPFGSHGPDAGRPADDALVAAAAGLLKGQSTSTGDPVFLTIPFASYGAAFLGAGAALAALLARDRTGKGQVVEVSWLAGALAMITGGMIRVPGLEVMRLTTALRAPLGALPAYRLYQCGDGGWLFIACGNDVFFNKLVMAIGRPELLADARFANAPWGIEPSSREALIEVISARLREEDREHWLAVFDEADVPAAPVGRREDFINDEQVIHNGMRVEIDDPELGPTVQMGVALQVGEPTPRPKNPAPRLRQHELSDLWSADQPPAPRAVPRSTKMRPGGEVGGATGLSFPNENDATNRLSSWQPLPPGLAPALLPAQESGDSERGPLTGVRVLDLSYYIAGPLGPQMLADYGADVIKVEPLAGEPFRVMAVGFLGWNRGKRSLAIDTRRREGREIIYDLAARADVLVENYRPGVTQRLGIDYESLRAINPRLVYCSVVGYGSGGPLGVMPAFDPLLQARSGAMAAQGGVGDPVFFTVPVSDHSSALLVAYGALCGLWMRRTSATGCQVRLSLTNATMAGQSGEFIFGENVPPPAIPEGEAKGTSPGYRLYRCLDEHWLFVACRDEGHWLALAQLAGLALPPYEESRSARASGPAGARLESVFAASGAEEMLRRLDDAGVPAVRARTPAEVFDDPQMRANALISAGEHPNLGPLEQAGLLVKFSATAGAVPPLAPLTGQHTREVLAELGISQQDIERLLEAGIVTATQQAS